MDLRVTTPFADTETCGVTPDKGTMGLVGARLVQPGSPATSVMASVGQAVIGRRSGGTTCRPRGSLHQRHAGSW